MPDVPDSADAHDLRFAGSAVADPPAAAESPGESVTDPVTDPVTAAADVLTSVAQPLGQPAPPPLTAVQLALYAGWTMAVLYGTIHAAPADDVTELPTRHELQPDQRRILELRRLRHLLQQLAIKPEIAGSGLPADVPADDASEKTLRDRLPALNLEILEALAVTRPEVELAYELGRSLRDTANPPPEREAPHAPALARQLGRGRIAKLQEWLATLSAQFPQHTAAIVAASLGRWSEFAAVTTQKKPPLKRSAGADVAATMRDYLLPQGDLWLMLLTGARSTSGLLNPEGYVAAGELALHRSAAIVRQVIRRYAVELLVVAAALGFIIYLAVNNLDGAARVWTTIAAIGGSLGISARTITSAASRLTAEAERPVFAMAEEDAMAWAITTLPPIDLTLRATQRLRRAGVGPKESLGRI